MVDQLGEKFEYINQRYLSCLFFLCSDSGFVHVIVLNNVKGETGTKAFVNWFVNFRWLCCVVGLQSWTHAVTEEKCFIDLNMKKKTSWDRKTIVIYVVAIIILNKSLLSNKKRHFL